MLLKWLQSWLAWCAQREMLLSDVVRRSPAVARESVCASETGTATAPAGAAVSSLSVLFSNVLRDGELVLAVLRPSRWFILLSSLRFLAIIAIITLVTVIFDERIRYPVHRIVEAGVFLAAGRLVWAVLQWMGRLYVLTDQRILRLSGVFNINVFECPLRKVARTVLDITLTERIFRIGSIVIVPQDEECPIGVWRMVAHPRRVHELILSTIARAKQ